MQFRNGFDQRAGIRNRPVVVPLPHLRPAFFDLLHDESTRKMAGLQLYVDENFASRPVDDIVALAVRHHFVPVIGEELVQVCQRILDIGWFVLLACLVVDGAPMKSR